MVDSGQSVPLPGDLPEGASHRKLVVVLVELVGVYHLDQSYQRLWERPIGLEHTRGIPLPPSWLEALDLTTFTREENVSVAVRIPTVFRKYTSGESQVQVDPGTIGELIGQLDSRYPGFGRQVLTDDGSLHRFVNVYVNNEDIRYIEKLDTRATEGDTVSLLPSVAGG
jgi:sulfur-carrier protein